MRLVALACCVGSAFALARSSPSSKAKNVDVLKDELMALRVLRFDEDAFPLLELVQEALGVDSLETLHLLQPEDFLPAGRAAPALAAERSPKRRLELLRHNLQERWKTSVQRVAFETQIMPRLVREVVAPTMPGEQFVLYQRASILRFHLAWPLVDGENSLPADAKLGALALLHADGDYGHPSGEVNYWLPLTQAYGSNSLFAETAPGRADYSPFVLRYGELQQWRGHSNRHYSHRNLTPTTRVSFDFRVIPGSAWREPGAPGGPHERSGFKRESYYAELMLAPTRG